jgi:hypothetical protein
VNDKSDLGQQALDKVAEVGIESQLDEVEAVDVDIRTNPLKAMQGEVDSVSINGKGMVMEKDLRVEEMQMRTGEVAINPLSVAFGKIELKRPTDASTHVVLTESDLNRAFNSDYIQEKLQGLEINVNGQPEVVDTQQVNFQLPGDQQVAITAQTYFRQLNEQKQVAFRAMPQKSADGQRIVLENVEYTEGKELSPELTQALLDKVSELLDLRNFELEGMSLKLQSFEIQPGRLTLEAAAHIEQFPAS